MLHRVCSQNASIIKFLNAWKTIPSHSKTVVRIQNHSIIFIRFTPIPQVLKPKNIGTYNTSLSVISKTY